MKEYKRVGEEERKFSIKQAVVDDGVMMERGGHSSALGQLQSSIRAYFRICYPNMKALCPTFKER